MKIGTCNSHPGKLTKGNLTVATYRKKELKLPIYIIEGENPGKTIFISAGMHGDEINGIEVLKHFMKDLNPGKVNGTIIFLPILNPWGFKEKSRYIPFDKKDLNRSFNMEGNSVTFRIARALMKEVIIKCEFGIDLHDGRANVLLPHARIFKKDKCAFLKEMSHAFGSDIILQREGEKGMMAIESFNASETPVLTIEVGGALVLREDFTKQVLRGLKNVLIYGGLLNGVLQLPVRQFFLEKRRGYTSPIQGILHLDVELGDAVEKGQIVARVHDPIKDRELKIKSQNPGVVFSVKREAIVDKDQTMLSILHFKVEKKKHRLMPIQAEILINRTKPQEIITKPTIILDNVFSLLGFSYKLVGRSLQSSLKKLDEYFKYAKHEH